MITLPARLATRSAHARQSESSILLTKVKARVTDRFKNKTFAFSTPRAAVAVEMERASGR